MGGCNAQQLIHLQQQRIPAYTPVRRLGAATASRRGSSGGIRGSGSTHRPRPTKGVEQCGARSGSRRRGRPWLGAGCGAEPTRAEQPARLCGRHRPAPGRYLSAAGRVGRGRPHHPHQGRDGRPVPAGRSHPARPPLAPALASKSAGRGARRPRGPRRGRARRVARVAAKGARTPRSRASVHAPQSAFHGHPCSPRSFWQQPAFLGACSGAV